MIYLYEDNIGFIDLVDQSKNDINLKVVNSARISYNKFKEKFDDKDKKLVKFLLESDPPHTSPFRHSWFTFHLKIPLFTMRQLVKYQVGSAWRVYEVNGVPTSSGKFLEMYDLMFDTDDKGTSWNEVSGRYVELKDEFYIPSKFRSNPGHGNKQASITLPDNFPHETYKTFLKDKFSQDYIAYKDLIARGIAKELARSILPQAIYTEAYWTVSLLSIINFLEQRLDKNAQYEIRQVATGIYKLLEDIFQTLEIKFEESST